MYKFLFLVFGLLFSAPVYSTFVVEGKVLDNTSKEPLAFVSIVIKGTQQATYTNLEGRFKMTSEIPITDLTFSYVGYYLLNYHIADQTTNLIIAMEQKDYVLNEVKVTIGENPAHRIIKAASRNRKKNNPDQIRSYTCQIYTKTMVDLIPNTVLQDSITHTPLKEDTTHTFLKSFIDQSHLLMMESVSERKYLFPDRLNETIKATRVSGFKNPSFSTTATDLQPFSFYDDYFNMLGKDYLNPITSGSTTKYYFQLEDTIYQEKDTVFLISFRPFKTKNFDGMEGVLYINTNGYAIQNVIASPYDKGLISIRIQQQYQFTKEHWFPQQLNYELFYKNYPSKERGLKLTGKSYISEVVIDNALRKKDFGFMTVTMDAEAAFKDSVYWKSQRLDTLTSKERRTYQLLDSLGKEANFDKGLKVLEALTTFQIPISYLNLDLNKIFSANVYEGTRWGVGFHTNDRLNKWFTIGGYIGYGIKDKALKYGGDAKVYLRKNSKDYFIRYAYSNDLSEPGKSSYFYTTLNLNRQLLTSRMDHTVQHDLSVNARLLRFLTVNVALNQSERSPRYPYNFIPNTDGFINPPPFKSTEVRVKARYAYKEKLVQSLGQLISNGSKYPILQLAYTEGFKSPSLGNYQYRKLSASLEKTILFKNIGKTNLYIEGGMVQGNIPYPYLFNGNGSYTKDGYLFVPHTFQTMGLYDFISDRYATFFITHHFGTLLFKSQTFKPEIRVLTGAGYGLLSNRMQHEQLLFKTMEKGYFESGLIIDNLYRINYLDVCFIGIGGGVFMRYGAYADKKPEDNMAFKLSMTVTF